MQELFWTKCLDTLDAMSYIPLTETGEHIMEMKLSRLSVRREEYGKEKGKLSGLVEFIGPYGKVELPLDERLAIEVVKLCSDGIVRVSRQVAEELTADVIEGTLSLPKE